MPRVLAILAVPLVACILWGVHASMAHDQALLAPEPAELGAPRLPVSAAFNVPTVPAPRTVIGNRPPISPAAIEDPATTDATPDWMTDYYKHPAPERMPAAIAAFVAADRDEASHLFELGFISAVFEQNPGQIAAWLHGLDKFSEPQRKLLLQAVWLSGTPEARAFLATVGRERLIADFGADPLAQRPVAADDRMVDRPADLAYYWGRFFASGRELPVRRIMSALPWLAEPPAANPFTDADKARAARWSLADAAQKSLAARATHDFRVLEICRAELATAPSASRGYLERVVAIAQAPTMPAR